MIYMDYLIKKQGKYGEKDFDFENGKYRCDLSEIVKQYKSLMNDKKLSRYRQKFSRRRRMKRKERGTGHVCTG